MTERIRVVRLYGVLGARFGRVHRLVVNSAAEAVHALAVQLQGFEQFFYEAKDRGMVFAVFHGRRNIGEDELGHPPGRAEIRIAPVIAGSKKAGLVQTVIGVALIVAATVVTGGFAGVAAGGLWGTIGAVGISLALGGVTQMMTKQPKGLDANDRPDNSPSYSFNGPVNTQAQGNPVPLLYGRMIVGSAVLSAGIYAQDQT
ncbi:tail assembly protein [Ectopseudomonas oleovorans]|uniref:Putative phage tail protein n=1 Tax=Ectopseudomonas oleovorans TaxID=301 RepID=A0A3D9EV28_ECTOL|nr:tail assembly protein [Pseudomonas oleovorans]RED06998.1 putative phage tail protein [Pseudomonas oleovorans]